MLDAIQGFVLIADPDRRVRFISRPPTGRQVREFDGKDLIDIAAPQQRLLLLNAISRIQAGAAAIELDAQEAVSKRWHRLRLAAVRDAGELKQIAVHCLDIDDGKSHEAELAVRRAADREATSPAIEAIDGDGAVNPAWSFEVMADALPVLISYVDAQCRYQYNNATYERWFGVSREQMRGLALVDVLGPAAYALIKGYVDEALAGRAVTFETTVPYKGAGLRQVIAHYVPDVNAHGRVRGFYALVEDITARREAEAELRQREDQLHQLQKIEALGRLAGGIAHDFNNLLQTIVIGCGAVHGQMEEGSSAARHVERVQRAAQRGRSMTRQLLAFSRHSDGLQKHPLDFDELVGDTALLLERLLDAQIRAEVSLNAHSRILADSGQIQQVLMNLAINARDAMPGGGLLRLETGVVTLAEADTAGRAEGVALRPGRYVRLTVADTGTGMDEATRARIFDPFFTTKPRGQGTGLGLSTVDGIVRQLGGHIQVESRLGEGTTFRLWFPCYEPEREREPDA